MILAFLLASPLQEPVTLAETVRREVRMHAVGDLVRRQQYAGLWYSSPAGGEPTLFPMPTFIQPMWAADENGVLRPQPSLPQGSWYPWMLPQPLAEADEGIFASVQEIEELATRFCRPPVDPKWERIQADESGWLVCYLRPEQHLWLERFLALQNRAERNWLAETETRWFTLSQEQARALRLDGSARLLEGADDVASMLAELERAGGESVTAPRLSTFPGRSAEVSVMNQVSYVKEYRLEIVEPGRREIADPVVDVIQEGVGMDVRVLQVADDLYGMRISCSSAEIERPIPTRRFHLSPSHPSEVEVAMPQVLTAQVDATVLIPDGGGVLLLASGLGGGRILAIVASFRRQPAEAR